MANRAACISRGCLAAARRQRSGISGSARGRTHGGVRWNRCRRLTSGWIRGTNWIAEAPVPTTATFLSVRSCSWFQRAAVEDGSFEAVEPGEVRDLRIGERAGAGDDDVGGQRRPGWSRSASARLPTRRSARLCRSAGGCRCRGARRPPSCTRGSPAGGRTAGSTRGSARRSTSTGRSGCRRRSPDRSCRARCRRGLRRVRARRSRRCRPASGPSPCRDRRSRRR